MVREPMLSRGESTGSRSADSVALLGLLVLLLVLIFAVFVLILVLVLVLVLVVLSHAEHLLFRTVYALSVP